MSVYPEGSRGVPYVCRHNLKGGEGRAGGGLHGTPHTARATAKGSMLRLSRGCIAILIYVSLSLSLYMQTGEGTLGGFPRKLGKDLQKFGAQRSYIRYPLVATTLSL